MKKIFFLWMTLGWLTALNAQWIEQNSGTTENLNDVFCITADTVVVVGDNGTILRTTNGGALWNPVTNPTTGNLHRVEFADTQTGYAVGDNGTVLKTTDAGQTWQSLNTGTNENLLALSCISNDTIYVAGTKGYVSKTIDGGQTWTDISIPNMQDKYIIRMQFIGTTGYIVLFDNYSNTNLFKTIDNGLNWTEVSNNNYDIDNFFWLNEISGYLNTNGGFAYSSDGLNTITLICWNYSSSAFDIDFVGTDTIWTVGFGGTTNDANYNILKFIIGSNGNGDSEIANTTCDTNNCLLFNAIDFYNENTGYVVGIKHNNQDTYGLILKNITGQNYFSGSNVAEISKEIFSISPNPAKNQVFINLKDSKIQYPVQYRIVDLEGKELTPFTVLQTGKPIDVSRLTNGIYLIQVQNQGQIYNQKLLIQK